MVILENYCNKFFFHMFKRGLMLSPVQAIGAAGDTYTVSRMIRFSKKFQDHRPQ